MPANYVPRKGDVILVRAVVQYDFDAAEDDCVHIKVNYASSSVEPADIVGVVSRRWDVGDVVLLEDVSGTHGVIRAERNGMYWVEFAGGGFGTYGGLDLLEVAAAPAGDAAVDPPLPASEPVLPSPRQYLFDGDKTDVE